MTAEFKVLELYTLYTQPMPWLIGLWTVVSCQGVMECSGSMNAAMWR